MRGRLGNGITLWLGGALLAHAALLALPGSEADGPASPAGGLKVRVAPPSGAMSTPTEGTEAATFGPPEAPVESAPETPPEVAHPTTEIAQEPERPAPPMAPRLAARASALTPASRPTPVVTRDAIPSPPVPARPVTPGERTPAPEPAAVPPPAPAVRDATDGAPVAETSRVAVTTPAVEVGPAADTSRARLAELTDRLHRAIEREKRYPLSARRLGREGTARVAFVLAPDGVVGQLRLDATSGEPALDRAALRAVRGISPFDEAGDYLDENAPFQVDIAFRLH